MDELKSSQICKLSVHKILMLNLLTQNNKSPCIGHYAHMRNTVSFVLSCVQHFDQYYILSTILWVVETTVCSHSIQTLLKLTCV